MNESHAFTFTMKAPSTAGSYSFSWRPPYTYAVAGLPPGITFTPSTRRAVGALSTVLTETTWPIIYSVTDGAGDGGRNAIRPHHRGIDVRGFRGDDVFTPVSGTVTQIEKGHGTNPFDPDTGEFEPIYPPNGNYVRIVDDAGRMHVFVHLHTVDVQVGDTVTAFQRIGTANNSGNSRGDHLHYTIWRDSSRTELLNPRGCWRNASSSGYGRRRKWPRKERLLR